MLKSPRHYFTFASLFSKATFRREPIPRYPYLKLDCYPEVPEVLSILKSRGFRLAILSNGTPAMLGLMVAWVNRFGQSEERLPGKPDVQIAV